MSTADSGPTGQAGRTGDDVRSDLLVRVERASAGGITVALRSRVLPYYGPAIEAQIRSVLEALGVANARVEIDDQGALPYVIAARVEAAARAAGAGAGRDARPARTIPLPPPSERARVRRSRLYLPGGEPKFFINAALHEPDAVILDLEDSVHPDHKAAARILVRNALRCVDFGRCERMVRINPLPSGLEDLAAVLPESPDVILIPKAESVNVVEAVDRAVRDAGHGNAGRPVWLMPILETALGIERAFDIACASDRICALTIGLEDYTADLGVAKSEDGDESIYARRRLINAAKAAGVAAIDSVYGNVADLDGLGTWAERSRRMGFEGMGCVHPRQIRVLHEAFAPSPDEVRKAVAIVAAFREADAKGQSVVSLGSKMIDPPVVARARRIVAQAESNGRLPNEADGGGIGGGASSGSGPAGSGTAGGAAR